VADVEAEQEAEREVVILEVLLLVGKTGPEEDTNETEVAEDVSKEFSGGERMSDPLTFKQ
jgi:hypothetical protein